MLKVMRKHARYFYVLFFIVILTFLFWGLGGGGDQQKIAYLIEVGDDKVQTEDYWRLYDRMVNVYRDVYKERFDEKMRTELKTKVLDTMVGDRLLLRAAKDMGLMVTDKELEEAVTSEDTFKRDGAFNKEVYLRTLELNRLSPAIYEDGKRRDLLLKKMRRFIEDSVELGPDEVAAISGDPVLVKTIAESMLSAKREAAVASFITGLRSRINVKVNKDLIS